MSSGATGEWKLEPTYNRWYRDFYSREDGRFMRRYDNNDGPVGEIPAPSIPPATVAQSTLQPQESSPDPRVPRYTGPTHPHGLSAYFPNTNTLPSSQYYPPNTSPPQNGLEAQGQRYSSHGFNSAFPTYDQSGWNVSSLPAAAVASPLTVNPVESPAIGGQYANPYTPSAPFPNTPGSTEMVQRRRQSNPYETYQPYRVEENPVGRDSYSNKKNFIGGGPGSVERLDKRYRRISNPKDFFRVGRVFALLWSEPFGDNGTEFSALGGTDAKFGEKVYSSIRRMVVVRERAGCSLCLSICTYGGRATTKPGIDASAHAIIYMRGPSACPDPLPEETGMKKDALEVNPAGLDQKLHPLSRINFSKVYTVEHNVKVMAVGKLTRESMPLLDNYFRSEVVSE